MIDRTETGQVPEAEQVPGVETESRRRYESHREAYERDRRAARDRSIADLLKELRDESTLLIRQEVLLAKQELSEKASVVGRNSGYLAAGAGIAYAGIILILFAISAAVYGGLVVMGLSHFVSGALAPAIVGVVVAFIAYSMIRKAQNAISEEMAMPVHTEETIEENTRWMKEKVSK